MRVYLSANRILFFFVFGTVFLSLLTSCGDGASSLKPLTSSENYRSFAERQVRYMAPYDLIQLMNRSFPVDLTFVLPDCKELTESNRALIGDSAPGTGSPIFDQPSSNFVRWYSGCILERIQSFAWGAMNDSAKSAPGEVEVLFFGSHLANLAVQWASEKNQSRLRFYMGKFDQLSSEAQDELLIHHIERLIGPSEVIGDFGYFKTSEDLARFLLESIRGQDLDIVKATEKASFLIALRDEYLSY